jgi:D-alanine-D-alanine ligase-like ATP-grasp enzyme
MNLVSQAGRAAFHGLRLLDIPAVVAQLRFGALRRIYYDRFWIATAECLGATCEKWDGGYHRLNRNGLTAIVRLSELRLDDHLTLDLMGNKALTLQLLEEQGFAVPRHVRFTLNRLKPALSLIATTGRPIVVKPASGTGGGSGVTTGITGLGGLIRAAWLASRFDPDLIAEEQIEGHSYRLLYLDGVLVDAIRRDPPRLTGDGKSTVRALVRAENQRRLNLRPFTALSPLRLDGDALNYLKAQNLTPASRLADGETIVVKRAVNQNTAADNHVVMDLVHPATIAACARLVANLGVRLAGLDILARDIAEPLTRENGLIGEINTTPGLHHHDLVAARADGRCIAAVIVEHLFKTRSGVVRDSQMPEQAAFLRKVAG